MVEYAINILRFATHCYCAIRLYSICKSTRIGIMDGNCLEPNWALTLTTQTFN